MSAALDLHPAYDLVVLESVDSAIDEATRLAEGGAEEGALVWAREQTAGCGRFGRPWESAAGNLHCALVLRPEESPAVAPQLVYVAAVSLGTAMAGLVSPLVELRYRWPNDILLYDAKVAGIQLAAHYRQPELLDWLVLGLSVNVTNYPQEADFVATSMHAEGGPDATELQLLQAFTRHFLSWANRWAQEGLAPVRKAWTQRADKIGQPLEVKLATETVKGNYAGLDDEGALLVELPRGGQRRIAVAEFFALPYSGEPAAQAADFSDSRNDI